MTDQVNSPDHYTLGGIETIDLIRAKLSREGFLGYLHGNAMKYLTRFMHKGNPVQDLEKCRWYIRRLEVEYGRQENNDEE